MEYHSEYTTLNSAAHRKPAAKLGAPGVCRQLNLWIPEDPNAPSGGKNLPHPVDLLFRARREAWVNHIDMFIANIFDHICHIDRGFENSLDTRTFNLHKTDSLYFFAHSYVKLAGKWTLRKIFPHQPALPLVSKQETDNLSYNPNYDLTITEIPARFQVVSFRFFWHGIPVRLQFGLHNEYLDIGIYIDLVHSSHDGTSAIHKSIHLHYSKLTEVCGNRYKSIIDPVHNDWLSHATKDRDLLKPSHTFLYTTIWEIFETEIFQKTDRLPSVYALNGDDEYLKSRIGFIIFDARGVLTHCPVNNSDKPRPFMSPPFHAAARQTLAENIALSESFADDENATHYTDAALPFIAAYGSMEDSSSSEYDERIEYTVSQFLRERVIYLSALAAEHTNATTTTQPIKFLILCRPFHRWQIGRLVERIFALGSVRVAALRNLDVLDKAGDTLRELTRRAQQLLQTPRGTTSWQAFDREVATLRELTARIGLECDGGLEYRIDRSRYYVQQYLDIEDTLDIGMVEGFQKDDIFARRRFFSTFNFIDRLGIRMERHKRDLALLGQQLQMRQNFLLERTSKNIQKGILKAQVLGELLLILPLTYYGGHIWEDGVGNSGFAYRWIFFVLLCIFLLLGVTHIREYRAIVREEQGQKEYGPSS